MMAMKASWRFSRRCRIWCDISLPEGFTGARSSQAGRHIDGDSQDNFDCRGRSAELCGRRLFGWTIGGLLKSGLARTEWLLTSGPSTRGRRCDLNPQATSQANWQCLHAKCWANQEHFIAAIAQISTPLGQPVEAINGCRVLRRRPARCNTLRGASSISASPSCLTTALGPATSPR